MTEKSAKRQGLQFTGFYERAGGKEKLKKEAARIRKEDKCRAVVVEGDSGYSIYAEAMYFDLQNLTLLNNQIDGFNLKTQKLLEDYQKALKDLQVKQLARIKAVSSINTRLGIN